jgi:hypothetical protein
LKIEGLQRIKKITNNQTAVTTVADLLELQATVTKLIRTLQGGQELIQLKSVWEDVANTDTTPSVAESLKLSTKFSNKRMDQYQPQEISGSTGLSPDSLYRFKPRMYLKPFTSVIWPSDSCGIVS